MQITDEKIVTQKNCTGLPKMVVAGPPRKGGGMLTAERALPLSWVAGDPYCVHTETWQRACSCVLTDVLHGSAQPENDMRPLRLIPANCMIEAAYACAKPSHSNPNDQARQLRRVTTAGLTIFFF